MKNFLIRLEGLIVLPLSAFVYFANGFNWWLFLLLFFVPDITAVFLLIYRKFGVWIYNVMHSYYFPATLIFTSLVLKNFFPQVNPEIDHYLMLFGIVWAAHIAFDHLFLIKVQHKKELYR